MINYQELAQSFQARHVAVAMIDAVAVRPEASATAEAARLSELNFDQAPVIDRGQVTGFVLTRHLRLAAPAERVVDHQTPIGARNLVSADAPVADLMEWIIDPGFLFVVDGRAISGFVTVADFNKQPARAYLYLLLATVEIGLAELLRHTLSGSQEELLTLVSDEARERIQGAHATDRVENIEGDYVSYLEFSEVLRVVACEPRLRGALGYESRSACDRAVGPFVKLRNEIMHPVRTLVAGKGALIRLQLLERRLHQFIDLIEVARRGERDSVRRRNGTVDASEPA